MLRFRSLRLIAGLAAAGLALAACGSSTTPGATSATTSSSATSVAPTSASMTSASMTSGSMTGTMTSGGTGESSTSGAETSGSGAPASGGAALTGDPASVKVGLAYDLGGRGDQSFNDAAAVGLDKAKAAGVSVVGELEAAANEPDSAKVERLNQLVDDGATDILCIGFAYAGPLAEVAAANANVRFAIIDDSSLTDPDREGGPLKNVASLTFAEEQGSYLVGAAAALKSEAGNVGFIGGVNTPLLQKFQAGFDAGAKSVKSDIKITDTYITEPPDFTGFNDPGKGETIAKGIYDAGADVIYAAAGGSGAGVFKAAKAAGKFGIGVDSDQYNLPSLANVKDVIITSMIKKVDVAVYDFIAGSVNEAPLTGKQTIYDLEVGGVDYSVSGGQVDDIKSQLDEIKADIISGEVTVPSTPES